MKRVYIVVLGFVFCVALSSVVTAEDQPGDARTEGADAPAMTIPVEPKVHEGDGWVIAAPGNWSTFRPIRPPTMLYLIGDGREGIPLLDGTLSPLKAGLLVEVFPKGALTLKEHVAKDLKELNESGAFKPLQDPLQSDVKLSDGTQAILLDVEFVRVQNGRVSFQSRLYCADAKGRHILASSFVTCSRPGRQSVKAIALPDFLRSHVMSLALDPKKMDAAALRPAYEKYNWNAAAALARAREGNRLLEKENFPEAAAAFRAAIEAWEQLPAAHNGLAWSLLHVDRPQADDLKEALREAQTAVKQTEKLDFSALDTLALAYQRNGEKEKAIKTIKQALKLQPNHPELRARLKSFE